MSMSHISPDFHMSKLSDDGTFAGYASVFNLRDKQGDTVRYGAFARSLSFAKQRQMLPAMLWMHQPSEPIGVWTNLYEDMHGLAVQGRLALDTQRGREAHALLKIGAISGLSIGYYIVKSVVRQGEKTRLLLDVDLVEISLVTFPANDAARVHTVKSPAVLAADNSSNARDDVTRAIVSRLSRAVRVLKNKN